MTFGSSPIMPATYPRVAELSIDLFTIPCYCKIEPPLNLLLESFLSNHPQQKDWLDTKSLLLEDTWGGDKVITH